MSRLWQIFCLAHLLACSLWAGELTFKNVHVRSRTLTDLKVIYHGYTAHQFEVENLSTTRREVTIRLPWDTHRGKSVIKQLTRTVALGPSSRKVVTLHQPPLPLNSYDTVAVITVDGVSRRMNDAFSDQIDSSDNLGFDDHLVVFASRSWSNTKLLTLGSSTPSGASGPVQVFDITIGKNLINQWPRHWLAYSGFDAVLLRAKEWTAAPTEVRQAVEQYVRAGGRLYVHGTISVPPDARKLNATRIAERQENAQAFKKTIDQFMLEHQRNDSLRNDSFPQEPAEEHSGSRYPETSPDLSYSTLYSLGWGFIRVIDGSANETQTNGAIHSALTFLFNEQDSQMPALVPVLAGAKNLHRHDPHFYYENFGTFDDYFPIVEDASVPVRLMIVILIGFVVLAGPVNLVVLHKLKRRTWFLWTLPAVSVLTAAVVFVTALVSEGFTPTVRRDVITILDHETQHAATIGALGIYAPVAPSHLDFSAHTEVTPLIPSTGQDFGENRSVDWTKGQRLTGKWVASRVPAHFALRKTEPRKERLSITWKGNAPTVQNSLGADIHQLWLADGRGNVFEIANLRAGQRAELSLIVDRKTVTDHADTTFLLSTNNGTPTSDYLNQLAPGTYLARLADSPFAKNPIGRGKEKTHALVYGVLTKTEAGP